MKKRYPKSLFSFINTDSASGEAVAPVVKTRWHIDYSLPKVSFS